MPWTVKPGPAASPAGSRGVAPAGPGTGGAPIGLPARGLTPAVPWTYSMSDRLKSGEGTRPKAAIPLCEYRYTVCVSGSYDPPGQFAPPSAPGETMVASGPSILLADGGVNRGPTRYFSMSFSASARSS